MYQTRGVTVSNPKKNDGIIPIDVDLMPRPQEL